MADHRTKATFCLFVIFVILLYLVFDSIFEVSRFNQIKTVRADNGLSCSLDPYIMEPDDTVIVNASVSFTATRVWTVITNGGTTLTTKDLTSVDGINYSTTVTTSSSYEGRNDTAVYATDATQTYICNPSDGSVWRKVSLDSIPWQRRSWHRSVEFLGRMWVVGGYDSTMLNDVWASIDGENWQEITAHAAWSPRMEFGLIVYDNKMWVIGGVVNDIGVDTYKVASDVWYTSDGVNWIQATANADWSAISSPGVVVYDNKMWVIAGCNSVLPTFLTCNGVSDEVWNSTNGVSWTRVTDAAAFGARSLGGALVHDDGTGSKMWVIAGADLTPTWYRDVWYSSDGQTWTRKTDNAAFGSRSNYGVATYDSKMWIFGGGTSSTWLNDSWYSTDGATWTLASDPADYQAGGSQPSKWTDWTARKNMQVVVHNNGAGDEIWILGGRQSELIYLNDIWHSSNGLDWELIGDSYGPEYGFRWGTDYAVLGSKMYLIGGLHKNNGGLPQDVWSTEDGVNWTCVAGPYTTEIHGIQCEHTSPTWSGRWGHKTISYDNKLWIIGGCKALTGFTGACSSGNRLNDVWYSSDGYTWTQATAAAPWTARYEPAVTVFNNKMWFLGGYDAANTTNPKDVYSSTNGTDWTLETSNAAWPGRSTHGAISYNDGNGEKLYLMGGYNTTELNDVWSSSDGVNWTQNTASALWDGRYTFGLVNYDGKMIVFGGNDSTYLAHSNDAYYSYNGTDWYLASDNTDFYGRDFFSYCVFNNRIYLSGGDGNGTTYSDVYESKIGLYFWVQADEVGQIYITGTIEPFITFTLPVTFCALGTLSGLNVKTCNYATQVSTNGVLGYIGYIRSDGPMVSGSNDINNVSGEYVAAGTEGYGVSTTESAAVDLSRINDANGDLEQNVSDCAFMNENTISAAATALSLNDQSFATASGPVDTDSTYLCHAASISGLTAAGYYTQTDTLTIVSNF